MQRLAFYCGLCLLLGLAGCKLDLYRGLNEQEANQMLALLMINRIVAQKTDEQGGSLKIRVEEADFVNAVEILRQNGYPKRQFTSVNELFPANQLVTSPLQEQAKLIYLKEQRLEQLISAMEGVINATVSIADPPPSENRRETIAPSASVLVKYSPDTNMSHFISQIKSLVHNSIPGLNYEAITVVLQAIQYRFLQESLAHSASPANTPSLAVPTSLSQATATWPAFLVWARANPLWVLIAASWVLILLGAGWYGLIRLRQVR
ncbi:MAG: type III secretion system inner membrane ring lipoprotein SctJ [Candidatus Symbiodolus clandestinus]